MNDDPDDDSAEKNTTSSGTNISVNIQDIFGIGKASESLKPVGSAIVNGLSRAWEPLENYSRKRAEGFANRHEAVADAKLMSNLDEIPAIDEQTITKIKNRFLTTEARRHSNISETVHLALEQSENENPDSLYGLDEDFTFEWLDAVQDVSDQEVQRFWASILAKAPERASGRISKAAVNLLKNFDPQVARSFQNFLKLVDCCGLPALKVGSDKWLKLGLEIDFNLLSDLNIIAAHTAATSSFVFPFNMKQSPVIASGNKGYLVQGFGVWGLNRIAGEIAECIPKTDEGISDEDTIKLLTINLDAITSDRFFNYSFSPIDQKSEIDAEFVLSARSENLWRSGELINPQKITENSDMLNKYADKIPSKFITVFRKYADEKRLKVCPTSN